MDIDRTMSRGWNKYLKKTDITVKRVEKLLAMRNIVNSTYQLDQSRIIGILSNVWGSIKPATLIHHTDRVQVFGIVMSIKET